jgi:hypothetical protein
LVDLREKKSKILCVKDIVVTPVKNNCYSAGREPF